MKSLLTLMLVLLFGVAAVAQKPQVNVQVETYKMGLVLDASLPTTNLFIKVKTSNKNDVARIYKFKNTRVKRALSFYTKQNKAKLA